MRQVVYVKKPHFLSEFFLRPIEIFEDRLPEYFKSLLANDKYIFLDPENRVHELLVKPWREGFEGKETTLEQGLAWFSKSLRIQEKTPEQKFKEKFFDFLDTVAEEFKKFKDELDPAERFPRETWMRFLNIFMKVYSKQVLWPLQPAETENSIHKQFIKLLDLNVPLTGVDTQVTVNLWENIFSPDSKVAVWNTEETIAENAKLILERENKLAEDAKKRVLAEKEAAAAKELALRQAEEYKEKEKIILKLIDILKLCEKETAGNNLSASYITFGKHSGHFFVNPVISFDGEVFKKKFEELDDTDRKKLLTHLVYAKNSLFSLTIGLPAGEKLSEDNQIKLLKEIDAARMDLFGKIETLLLVLTSDPNLLTLPKFAELNKEASEFADDLTAKAGSSLEQNISRQESVELKTVAVKSKKNGRKKRAATPVVVIEDGTSTPLIGKVEEGAKAERFTGVPSSEQLKAEADVPVTSVARKEGESFPLHFDDFAIDLLMDREFPKANDLINSRFFDDLISEIERLKKEGIKEAQQSEAYCNQKVADINKNFNDIFYKRPDFLNKFIGQDPSILKTHFPRAINQLLNDRWKQFQEFWTKYAESHKNSEGQEPFLHESAMRALFIGFIFSAWPSNETPEDNARTSFDPFNALILSLKDALEKYNFANSITFREWAPNFNCKFNDNFELNEELCPFDIPSPGNSVQHEGAAVTASEIVPEVVTLVTKEVILEEVSVSRVTMELVSETVSKVTFERLLDVDDVEADKQRVDELQAKLKRDEQKEVERLAAEKERIDTIIECLKDTALNEKKIWNLLGNFKIYSDENDAVPKLGTFSDEDFIQKFKESDLAIYSGGYTLEKQEWLLNLVEIREELRESENRDKFAKPFSETIDALCENLKANFKSELKFAEEQVNIRRNIRKESLSLICLGIEALKTKINSELAIAEEQEKGRSKAKKVAADSSAPTKAAPSIQDSEVRSSIDKDEVAPLAAKSKAEEVNEAIKKVIIESASVINQYLIKQNEPGQLVEAKKTFAEKTQPEFRKIVDKHKVLSEFDGFWDGLFTILKNVVLLVSLPFGGFTHMHSRHKQGMPRWIQPRRAEGLFRVLQKELPEEIRKAPLLPVQPMAPISN